MASTTRLRDRIFAASGAILFLITSVALTVVVIVQLVQDSHAKKAAAADTTSACTTDAQTEQALAAPQAFIPDGDVTSLQSTDIKTGSGAAAKAGDCLVMKYYGTLAKDGTLFDENYTKTTGFEFTLGGGQVIKGWDQGLLGMQAGGERRLVIPADLAYGSQSPGSTIPANSALVFDVTLLRIQK